jgi:uncharacterized membrane protein YqjE
MMAPTGLTESLKRMAGTLLAIFQTRLELLSNEMEEEVRRFEQILLYGGIALLFFGLSIMLLTVFVVVVFWDSQRLPVLGSLAGLFFIAGLLVWNALRRLTSKRTKLFSASLAELSDDRDQLAQLP